MPLTLHIKNMVCDRCIRVVREELSKLGLDVRSVILGEAVVASPSGRINTEEVRAILRANGFDLLDDADARTIEHVKRAAIAIARGDSSRDRRLKHSATIASAVGRDYKSVSALFSSLEGMTIETYIILQRIERVKELLRYDEKTLSEIAFETGYSSVAHLSNQFKKVTGLSATEYKRMKDKERVAIDKISVKPSTLARRSGA